MRVALTGSRGLLGRELVRQLGERGADVVLLGRSDVERAHWKTSCASIDVLIHLAAPTSGIDAAAVDEALTQTRELLDALPDRPLRVIFAGSMALYVPPPDAAPLTETSEMWRGDPLLDQDLYTQMKSAQESAMRSRCAARGDRLVIIRPTNVWDQDRWWQSCIGPKAGPIWFVVAPPRQLRLTHVGNCARAFVAAIDVEGSTAETAVNIDDNAGVTAWRYARHVVGRERRRYVPVPLPGWLFNGLMTVAGVVLSRVAPRRQLPGLFLRDRRDARFGDYAVDTGAARQAIGWAPDLGAYGSGAGGGPRPS